MSLADIGLYLDSPEASPLAVVERQLHALDRQIAEAARVREQLQRLHGELAAGGQPDLSTWLHSLEQMSMYEKYFTQEELAQLPMYHDEAVRTRWHALVEEASTLMRSQSPDSGPAKDFARRWLDAFQRSTGDNPRFATRLNLMAVREQGAIGVSPEVMNYALATVGELKFEVWAKYLQPQVIARMRQHYATRGIEWPDLTERVRAAMQADPKAAGVQARELARQWLALFHDMVGTEPETVEAFRRASASEPLLRMGSGISEAMLEWLRQAMPKPPAQ
jgi:hypothetical protein